MFNDISKILLITDLDGTLLPHSKTLSDVDLNAINKFIAKGGKFSIATGRAYQSVKQYFDKLNFSCPIILYNGSMIYDNNYDTILWSKNLPLNARLIVNEIMDEFPSVAAEILTFENIYVLRNNEREKHHIGIAKISVCECTLDEIPDGWLKILFAFEPEIMPKLIKYVNAKKYDNIQFVASSSHFFEMLPLNTTKGTALKKLIVDYGYSDYTVVAVGDYNNDIEMLEVADIGIATSNAQDEVKKIADITLKETCNENAIASVIDYIFKQCEKN